MAREVGTGRSPIQQFFDALATIGDSLLRTSDSGNIADVEAMLDALRREVDDLTPWTDALICTGCRRTIPAGATGTHPADGPHRALCADCWAAQFVAADEVVAEMRSRSWPTDAELWNGDQ
jgi:hypothetical protein